MPLKHPNPLYSPSHLTPPPPHSPSHLTPAAISPVVSQNIAVSCSSTKRSRLGAEEEGEGQDGPYTITVGRGPQWEGRCRHTLLCTCVMSACLSSPLLSSSFPLLSSLLSSPPPFLSSPLFSPHLIFSHPLPSTLLSSFPLLSSLLSSTNFLSYPLLSSPFLSSPLPSSPLLSSSFPLSLLVADTVQGRV